MALPTDGTPLPPRAQAPEAPAPQVRAPLPPPELILGTHERASWLFLAQAAGSFISAPVVLLLGALWWQGSEEPEANGQPAKRWLRACTRLAAVDLLLLFLLGGVVMSGRQSSSRSTFGEDVRPEGEIPATTVQEAAPAVFGANFQTQGAIDSDLHLVVERVFPLTAAAEIGLEPGDEVVAIDRISVATEEEILLVLAARKRRNVEVSFFRRGKIERARATITDPPAYLVAERAARASFRRRDFPSAEREFARALAQHPKPSESPSALLGLALSIEAQGRRREARAILEESMAGAQPAEQDALRIARCLMALRAGDGHSASMAYEEIEPTRQPQEFEPVLLATQNRSGDGFGLWLGTRITPWTFVTLIIAGAVWVVVGYRSATPERVARLGVSALAVAGLALLVWVSVGTLSGAVLAGNSLAFCVEAFDPTPRLAMETAWWSTLFGLSLIAHRTFPSGVGSSSTLRPALGLRSVPRRVLGGAVGAGLCLLFGFHLRFLLVAPLIGLAAAPNPVHPLVELATANSNTLSTFVWLAIVAPFAEEFFLRGFLHSRLRAVLGPWESLCAATVAGGLLQGGGPQLFWLAAGQSAVFFLVREKTGSILPSLLLNAGFNLTLGLLFGAI